LTSASLPPYRLLGPVDLPEARGLAARAGAHGVYVDNSLAAGEGFAELVGLPGPDVGLQVLSWFGERGNLVVLADEDSGPGTDELVAYLHSRRQAWRICLGPAAVVRALAALESSQALVDRTQVYYRAVSARVPRPASNAEVRLAVRADIPALVEASLDLHASDLLVPAWRVHRGWLRDSVRARVRAGQTFVIGPVGAPLAKLDLGSSGSAGVVLEGVHTVPSARGRGLASRLVGAVSARLVDAVPMVCLHVDQENAAARRAYARAGMDPVGSCRLLLRG
jgi:GNAT superfamily N-acetyltransferase